MTKNVSEDQIIGILKGHEGGVTVAIHSRSVYSGY